MFFYLAFRKKNPKVFFKVNSFNAAVVYVNSYTIAASSNLNDPLMHALCFA